ncbi:MAG: hypothetical protein Q8928_16810 [Bacteroidota bacterium]|nr:hypothetical protein [Bacteroidota bacterium]
MVVVLICGLAWSCGNSGNASSPGRILRYSPITRRVCASDTSQHYELYLPSGYNAQKKWPVIFAFDPHGDGKLAVESLKEAAERFGYILIGSDNSKNGSSSTAHILSVLLNEVSQTYPVDLNRQYAAGFSGGGSVASYLAVESGNIRGIITCGAGIPGFNPQMVSKKFEICAIAGREDFNYTEVVQIPNQLSGSGWRNMVCSFDGGHRWPPSSLIVQAVLWFEANAMRDGLKPKDESLLLQFRDSTNNKVDKLVKNHLNLNAANECRMGIDILGDLINTKTLTQKLAEIENSDTYKNEKNKEAQLLSMEQRLKEGYIQSFENQGLDWWTSELKLLIEKAANEKDMDTRQMYCRVKAFLGIICYSFTSKAIAENKLDLASKYIGIYETVEPKNPDCFYYKAILLDRKKQFKAAVISLKRAIEYGFNDIAKINATFSKQVQSEL